MNWNSAHFCVKYQGPLHKHDTDPEVFWQLGSKPQGPVWCTGRGTSIAPPVQSPLWKSLKALHHSETAHHGGKRLAWRWCQFSLFRFSRSSVASSREYWPKKRKKIRLQIQAAEMSFRPPAAESWTSVTKDKNPFYLFIYVITLLQCGNYKLSV